MNVYRVDYDVDANPSWAAPDDWVTRHPHFFDGQRRSDEWDSPLLTMIDDEGERPADFMAVNFAADPLVTTRGRNLLVDVLGDDVELLALAEPLHSLGYEFANITNVADCFDEDATEFRVGPSGERGSVYRWVFRADALRGVRGPFKIPLLRDAALFATEEFKERYDASGLTGMIFQPIWSGS